MKSVRSCACVGGAAAAAASTAADDLLEVVPPLSPLPRFARFAVENTRRAQTGLQLGAPKAKPAAEAGRCHRILLPAPRERGGPQAWIGTRNGGQKCGVITPHSTEWRHSSGQRESNTLIPGDCQNNGRESLEANPTAAVAASRSGRDTRCLCPVGGWERVGAEIHRAAHQVCTCRLQRIAVASL